MFNRMKEFDQILVIERPQRRMMHVFFPQLLIRINTESNSSSGHFRTALISTWPIGRCLLEYPSCQHILTTELIRIVDKPFDFWRLRLASTFGPPTSHLSVRSKVLMYTMLYTKYIWYIFIYIWIFIAQLETTTGKEKLFLFRLQMLVSIKK